MQKIVPLEPGKTYHIYTRGNNQENIFLERRNYAYFLQLYQKYITPFAHTYAYCLLRNHFHFLIKVKSGEEVTPAPVTESKNKLPVNLSRQFSHLFNAYAKTINKTYSRTGSLFQERFRRILVTNETYFTSLVFYIHFNPQKHGFVGDFREWPHSSYHSLLSTSKTRLERETVQSWFGGKEWLVKYHENNSADLNLIREVIEDD